MLRSMYSGIGGMKNFQTKLDVIGNNIANVNTFGYKKGRTTFQDLMSQQMRGASTPTENRGGTNPMQVGLGGTIATIDTIHTQGSMQTTGRSLDVGISGDGFFIVSDGNLNSYTRAGNFYLDQNGTLVNGDGLRVMGYGLQAGTTDQIDYTQIQTLQIQAGSQMAPGETTSFSLKGNLNSSTPTGEIISLPIRVIDSLGEDHEVTLELEKGANPGEWVLRVDNDTVTVTFDEFGRLVTPASVNVLVTTDNGSVSPINGSIEVDLSQITQFFGSNTLDLDTINGNIDGFLESFNIGPSGEIVGVYSNGRVQVLGQLALATFNNSGGLNKSGNNLFQASNNSGQPNIGAPGEGRGLLMGSALEMSNVDLSEEFTEMIVAQRGFQANTRIITTSDEILQELVNLKR